VEARAGSYLPSIEHRVALMSPAERVARAEQLLESAVK
jgi:hypothetical protein